MLPLLRQIRRSFVTTPKPSSYASTKIIPIAVIPSIAAGCLGYYYFTKPILNTDSYLFKSPEITSTKSYDFIVVGGGLSGSITAIRLASHKQHPNVLLIESGQKPETNRISSQIIPIYETDAWGTGSNWGFWTTQQTNMNNRKISWPRGKTLGGSTAINGMMWVRGNKNDWDKLFDIDGWKWENVLPYFKKCENCKSLSQVTECRGKNGPMNIEHARDWDINKLCIAACNKCNIEFNPDYNNDMNQMGVSYTQYNIDKSRRRNSAFIGYMKWLFSTTDYKNRQINLDILSNSHATQIIFDDACTNKENQHICTSVKFVDTTNDKEYTANLKNTKSIKKLKSEIIVCCGAIQSPQLLMLSGIGPAQILQKFDIKMIQDLKGVGYNLRDHIGFMPRYVVPKNSKLRKELGFYENQTWLSFLNYFMGKKSILDSSALDVTAFLKTDPSLNYPDIQLIYTRGINGFGFGFVCDLLHTESFGEITLKSSDPFDYPIINPNYFSDKNDIDLDKCVKGLKIVLDIFQTDIMKENGITIDENDKILEDKDLTDEIMKKWLRETCFTGFHPVGTCKMGNVMVDEYAVVDNKLKVYNCDNLRVIDASIMPRLPSGNTQLPCYMIAEKGSDIILDEWSQLLTFVNNY